MLYTPMTKKALNLCFQAHKNQLDKGGMPYVFHPLHLAEQMDTEEEICVALLHDIIEDTAYTEADLRQAGFSVRICEALSDLTHSPAVPYMDYIVSLRSNPLARKVKQADLIHNMDLSRLDHITKQDLRRQQKYQIALAILSDDPPDIKTRVKPPG